MRVKPPTRMAAPEFFKKSRRRILIATPLSKCASPNLRVLPAFLLAGRLKDGGSCQRLGLPGGGSRRIEIAGGRRLLCSRKRGLRRGPPVVQGGCVVFGSFGRGIGRVEIGLGRGERRQCA